MCRIPECCWNLTLLHLIPHAANAPLFYIETYFLLVMFSKACVGPHFCVVALGLAHIKAALLLLLLYFP